jgi:hypothetical protein
MSELVADCPRCGSKKITFDLIAAHFSHLQYNWQMWYAAFCVCRHCDQTVVYILSQTEIRDSDYIKRNGLPKLEGSANNYFKVEGFVSIKDFVRAKPPEHLPENIKGAFEEGATCMAVNCFNAGATMFRLCIDHATNELLPPDNTNGLNRQIRRSLGLRLPWLFDNGLLPESLRDLSACIKEDGNDGAHEGTLSKQDAEDILDFTFVLLERLYTEPERLKLAQIRRDARRTPSH